MLMETRKINTQKTARYFILGKINPAIRQVWFICHGYGQLGNYFLQQFAGLDNPSLLLVSCEGLNRFYVNGFSGRVGASWMTKEDREEEIADYVTYLDGVYQEVMGEVRSLVKEEVKITAFGFSQGTATVCRWIAAQHSSFHRMVLWAGTFPPDVDLQLKKELFDRMKNILILGDRDEFIKNEEVSLLHGRLDEAQIPYELIRFEGKHELNRALLEKLITV
jgi:predicted esterase